ncbi:MAG: MGDG synthase family glycosyltransferase [Pelotomaculum sp.]
MGKIGKLKKVLILSVSVGTGHMRTAEAIKKACGVLAPEAEVVILDTFHYINPLLDKVVFGTYMEMLKMTPVVYGFLYRMAEQGTVLAGRGKDDFNKVLSVLSAPKLTAYIKSFEPQVIVCTHAFPLGIISYMKKWGKYKGLTVAAITDFTVHPFWIFPGVDSYIVGAEALVHECEQYGIEKDRIRATGIPIDIAFANHYEKRDLRVALGLETNLTTILLVGGGLGMGPILAAVEAIGNNSPRCQLLVVAGKNKGLYEQLAAIAPHLTNTVHLYGFVDNMHQLMAASDLMISKAGGLTCAEALSSGLPMFIVDPLPGHEERNTEFMCSMQAGVKVKEENLAEVISYYLQDESKIKAMADAARSLGKPDAAFVAVQYLLQAVEGAQAI